MKQPPSVLVSLIVAGCFVAPGTWAHAQVCALSDDAVTASSVLELLQAAVGRKQVPACSAAGLPATGSNACYDADGAGIDCEGSGQDGELRTGIERSFTNHGDGTISDHATGLVWEAKCDGWSCPELHDKDTEYAWNQAFTSHVATLNAMAFGGFDDWRVPNVLELFSLWDPARSLAPGQRWFEFDDLSVFDAFDTCTEPVGAVHQSCTGVGAYWSSTSGPGVLISAARLVGYDAAAVSIDANWKRATAKVRAVRGGRETATAAAPLDSAALCVRSDARVSATEALRWLRVSTGQLAAIDCPAGGLPATGQQTCTDSSGDEIACAGTGHDGDVRAGDPRAFTNYGDGTISDDATGLMWETKCAGPSCPPLHDVDATYTWDEAFAVHVAALNTQRFAGHGDWRVPNISELLTLWNGGEDVAAPTTFDVFDTCDDDCGLATCSCTGTARLPHWSSTTAHRHVNGVGERRTAAFTLWFRPPPFDGLTRLEQSELARVRAVRGGRLRHTMTDPPADRARAGKIAVYGSVGIAYEDYEDNMRLVANLLADLGEGRAIDGELRILATADCDPRTAPDHCHVGEPAQLAAFYEMIASLGTIEYGPLTTTTRADYSLVIADFCDGLRDDQQLELLRTYLRSSGRALVVADQFCWLSEQVSSADVANRMLEPFGIRYVDDDTFRREPLAIPPDARTGLLEGVGSLHVTRVLQQEIHHTFEPVVELDLGAIAATAWF